MKISFKKYIRVLQIARKPSKEEFTASSKISLAGLIVIGLIGFAIFLIGVISGI